MEHIDVMNKRLKRSIQEADRDPPPCRVYTQCRLAQCRVYDFPTSTRCKSESFKMGNWTWHLRVEEIKDVYVVRQSTVKNINIALYPEMCEELKDKPPIASFIIRVLGSNGNTNVLARSEIKERYLTYTHGFVWSRVQLPGKFIIEIEFLDLKTSCPNGGVPCSIWPDKYSQRISEASALDCFGRILKERIHTDVTIRVNSHEESIRAHKAILVARSPVFHNMFSHNFKENDESIINISDMSIETCHAFLNYLYGIFKDDEFMTHRVTLLHAADKYDIVDLKIACGLSLLEDIDAKNVLERLQIACMYQLPELKNYCMQYLVKSRKIFDIRDDFTAFLQNADKDLISEVFNEVLDAWKGS